jgi:hypothetical protein
MKPILTEETYFSAAAELYYMGSTQFKAFQSCESAALAMIRGQYVQEKSTALLVGSYVDAHFSRTLDIFKAQHPEIFNSRTGALKSDYQQANNIIARIERDELFLQAISGEPQVIMTGEIEGVPVKIKIDSLLPDRTVDLKIMKDFDSVWSAEDGCRVPWWQALRYDIQAALYQHVRAQNEDGVLKPFGLACATKEKEPDIGLFEFPQSVLDAAMDEVRSEIVHFDNLKKGLYAPEPCGKCDWCRSQKILTGWEELV